MLKAPIIPTFATFSMVLDFLACFFARVASDDIADAWFHAFAWFFLAGETVPPVTWGFPGV